MRWLASFSDNLKSKTCPERCRRNKKRPRRPRLWGIFAIVLAFALDGRAVAAQQPAKMPKIGFLGSGFASAASATWLTSFQQEFLRLGYVEGKNVVFEFRHADNQYDRLPTLANEMVGLKVDVIVTPGSNDTRAAKNATRTIPIVFLGTVSDPVSLGLVDSLARPGGNVTGFTTIGSVLAGKRLELLKETVSMLSRVAVLWDPQNAGAKEIWKESQLPARELGLQLHSLEVTSADKFESGFKAAIQARSGAVAITGGALVASNQKQIIQLAAKYRLPAIYPAGYWIAGGGLMSYGADDGERFRRAAVMVDKILKGAKPADLPVEQPTKFELMINLKTAKTLGLTIPPIVLMRAEKVIK
jgi:putative ABC transport system substrate-binding protein